VKWPKGAVAEFAPLNGEAFVFAEFAVAKVF
jgi:hypothetical protein